MRRRCLHYMIMDLEITSDMLEQFALDRINTILESVKARPVLLPSTQLEHRFRHLCHKYICISISTSEENHFIRQSKAQNDLEQDSGRTNSHHHNRRELHGDNASRILRLVPGGFSTSLLSRRSIVGLTGRIAVPVVAVGFAADRLGRAGCDGLGAFGISAGCSGRRVGVRVRSGCGGGVAVPVVTVGFAADGLGWAGSEAFGRGIAVGCGGCGCVAVPETVS